jgi:hypothetical protein
MLHITVTAKKAVDPEKDGIRRPYVGYEAGMTQDEMYEANRGEWAIGARGKKERYVLFSFGRTVIQALEIEDLYPTTIYSGDPNSKRDDRYSINGKILSAGHPVYDKYVGKPSPVGAARNPVRYFEDPEFDGDAGQLCRCGCGEMTTRGDFVPGHDQKAIHERIARIGTVAEFLDWMDVVRPASLARQS